MNTHPSTQPWSLALPVVRPIVATILLGLFVLYGAGFAGPTILHNAAHDSRHAFGFPCH